jgi:primosomal protein N' (replication factor Y)
VTESQPIAVALDLPLRTGDAAFTFAAGPAAGAPRGAGVVVPFGRRLLPGIVLGEGIPRPALRVVLAVVEPLPLVPPHVVSLAEWTAREYLSSVGEALKVAVPWDALWSGAALGCADASAAGLTGEGAAIAARLHRVPMPLARASRLASQAPDVLEALAKVGMLTVVWRRPAASSGGEVTPGAPDAGSDAARPDAARLCCQVEARAAVPSAVERALREAMAAEPRALLVAGWNRTPTYLLCARIALAAGWSTLVLFASVHAAAEFAQVAAAAGLSPVLVHGELSVEARRSMWESLRSVRGRLVVGTRAAVFAPVADPVLAIVDEEDSSGHKEDRAPRILTRSVAEARTREAGLLVLGSTTPTVATWAAAQAGRLRLVALPSPRPRLGTVDLRRRQQPAAPVSAAVADAVARTARAGGRALILADRKGYASGLHCAECGIVERCPQCSIALVYERTGRRLICRLCGVARPAPATCPRCGAARFRLLGAGTERLAALFRRLRVRVWRLDAEVAAGTHDVAAYLAPFRAQGGVLVATTIVLPHLEWLRPDVVAVVSADRWLHRPEFRAAERALALLRTLGIASGARVLVETSHPDHPVLRATVAASLRSFYAQEIALRQALGYPPFCTLVAVGITARSASAAAAAIDGLAAAVEPPNEMLGPVSVPSPSERWVARRLVLKIAERSMARGLLWPLLTGTVGGGGVRVTADVDPPEL